MALKRIENDLYETDEKLTKLMLKHVPVSGTVLECCAGKGAIANVLRRCDLITQVKETDINMTQWEREPNKDIYTNEYDATTLDYWKHHSSNIDYVVTNPPFSVAPLILPHALEHAKKGVVFLLRLSYLEPCANRYQWLIDNADQQRSLIAVNPRPRFRPGTKRNDSVTVAWLYWCKSWSWKRLGITPPFIYEHGWR